MDRLVTALPAVSQRRRDFYLVVVKLMDVAARGGFVLRDRGWGDGGAAEQAKDNGLAKA